MRKMWSKLFGTAALAFMLCLVGTAFAQQCVDNEDGTVTDKADKLVWQKSTVGPMNWNATMSYVSGLSLSGYSDWLLSDANTLGWLYSSECKSMLEGAPDSSYWSSSPSGSDALTVAFHNSNIISDDKSCNHQVRAVRQDDVGNTKWLETLLPRK